MRVDFSPDVNTVRGVFVLLCVFLGLMPFSSVVHFFLCSYSPVMSAVSDASCCLLDPTDIWGKAVCETARQRNEGVRVCIDAQHSPVLIPSVSESSDEDELNEDERKTSHHSDIVPG